MSYNPTQATNGLGMTRVLRAAVLALGVTGMIYSITGSAAPAYSEDVARAMRAGDYDTARSLLRERAEAGEAEAQLNLGVLLATGQGSAPSPQEAVRWYREAAEQGNASAQNNLGRAYLEGMGVRRQPDTAARWFRDAAEQGDAGAQYNLGTLYAQGRGVERDMTQAVQWWRKAAEQGVIAAQYNMGAASADGVGVKQSDAAAVYWFANAAQAGNSRARGELEAYVSRLPTQRIGATNVQIRAGAGTDTPVVTRMQRGARVSVLGRSRDDWTMIYMPERQELGWVASRLLDE